MFDDLLASNATNTFLKLIFLLDIIFSIIYSIPDVNEYGFIFVIFFNTLFVPIFLIFWSVHIKYRRKLNIKLDEDKTFTTHLKRTAFGLGSIYRNTRFHKKNIQYIKYLRNTRRELIIIFVQCLILAISIIFDSYRYSPIRLDKLITDEDLLWNIVDISFYVGILMIILIIRNYTLFIRNIPTD